MIEGCLNKGEEIELEITDIDANGQGIGRKDGMTVFVSAENGRIAFGDIVIAKIEESKKKFLKAKCVKILKKSTLRSTPPCGYTEECGGCPLQNMTYEGQLALKGKQVRDKYTRIAMLKEPEIREILGMAKPFRYRNKAQIHVGNDAVGFFGAKSHDVVDCKSCCINAEPAEVIAGVVREFAGKRDVSVYDRATGKGLLRHVIVRTAFGTGEVMVIFVLNGRSLPGHEELIKRVDDAVYGIKGAEYSLESVALNVNTEMTSRVTGKEYVLLAGKPVINDVMGGLEFEISPESFYQVNPVQAEKLYNTVLEYADLTGVETVLDVYCGVGTIGLWCASKARQVIGIEIVKEAVRDADRNSVINGIVNSRYICGQAEAELPKLAENGFRADVVILDPPRAGCKPKLLEAVSKTNAKRIIYVACDIATQARDIKILTESGYAFVSSTPVDMFPWGMSVEAVCLLTRVSDTNCASPG